MAASPTGPVSRHGDLYLARRDHRGDPFRAAVALDELNTASDERNASLSEDQQTLYFDQRDPAGRYHLLIAARPAPAEHFGAAVPVNLGDATGSTQEPFLTSTALYFVSARSDGTTSVFAA